MVMPSSGPISMAQAHAEFGLGYSLSAYYGCDSGVPTSGPISLAHLYGKKKRNAYRFYRLFNMNPVAANFFAAAAEIELREFPGGADMTTANSGYVQSGGLIEGSLGGFFDGNLLGNNRFNTATPRFIAIDLTTPRVVREIALYVHANNNIGSFQLYGSNTPTGVFTNTPTGSDGTGVLLASYSGLPAIVNAWHILTV